MRCTSGLVLSRCKRRKDLVRCGRRLLNRRSRHPSFISRIELNMGRRDKEKKKEKAKEAKEKQQEKRKFKKQKERMDMKKYETEMAQFKQQILGMKLKIKEIQGDGNCLFRAISD